MGRALKGVYHLLQDKIYLYDKVGREKAATIRCVDRLDSEEATKLLMIFVRRSSWLKVRARNCR
jgi:peptide subunit release factor RF-3